MKRPRPGPAAIDFTRRPVAAESIVSAADWSPEQAVAVFEILDELRDRIWERYGLQIQQVLRDQRSTAFTAADDIDDADVPF